jgi:uncharacterized protein YbbC (DUF1343 family)
MINGEGWLPNKLQCRVKIIPVANYTHEVEYIVPVSPSPNLNSHQSIMLYPSTCLFEGTALNHGRGTYSPFAVIGSPALKGIYNFAYVPKGIPGMSETPLFMNDTCYGLDLRRFDVVALRKSKKINLRWMMELYRAYPAKEKFFDRTISKQIGNIDFLSGDANFKHHIMSGKSEEEIRKSWEPALSKYKTTRKKYLLYP